MKKKIISIWLRIRGKHICEHKDCLAEGAVRCRLAIYDYEGGYYYIRDEIYYYCADHCHEEGFCYGCGEFWGGCENFDFSPYHLCSNCKDELDDEADCEKEYDFDYSQLP
jgi:hypothetical protein